MSIFNKIIFNLWYYRRPPWDSGISPPELFQLLTQCTPGRAIDMGCGTATNVITLAQHGWQITGIDFAPNAIKKARQKTQKAGINADLRLGDATQLEGIQGPFDLAIDFGCFQSLSLRDRTRYLKRLNEVLAPAGDWFMYGFFKQSPYQAGPGLVPADIELIGRFFPLISRQDGFDKRKRSSAYFLFQKQ